MKTVIVGIALLIIPFGIRSGFGLFLPPISFERGWGIDVFSLTLAIQFLLFGLFAPFIGLLCDKFSGGRIYFFSAITFAVAFLLSSIVESIFSMHVVGGVVMAMGVAGTSMGVILPVMAKAVTKEKQSLVLGLGSGIAASGQFFFPPLLQWLLSYGVVTTFQVLAGVLLTISFLTFLLPRSADKKFNNSSNNATPYNKKSTTAENKNVAGLSASTFRFQLTLAMYNPSLWWLAFGFASCGFYVSFIGVHIPNYLTEEGFSLFSGANALSLIGLFNVAGCYIAGHLGGIYSKKKLLIALYIIRFVLIVVFLCFPITQVGVYLFSSMAGLLWLSTVPLTMGLVTQLFSLKYTTTIYGVVFLFHQLGGFVGIYLGSASYERFDSYLPVWWIMAGLSLLSAFLHLPIKEKFLLAEVVKTTVKPSA